MLKKFLSSLRKSASATASESRTGLYSPYAEPHVNYLYNLLFCDDVELFRNDESEAQSGPWQTLLAERPDKAALAMLAADGNIEGRLRALAYNRLRALGETPEPKILLGIIVEVPLQGGLDVLAAFSDGGVRYLNQSGKVAVFDGAVASVGKLAQELLEDAQRIVDNIGPWKEQRLPPPKMGNVRLTFLVSDGLYFGEGPFSVLQRDGMAGPVLMKAAELLKQATELATG